MSKPVYAVGATKIETFRKYMYGEESPFNTEQNLIDTLKGIYIPNDKTRFGSVCHTIIEEPSKNHGVFKFQEVEQVIERDPMGDVINATNKFITVEKSGYLIDKIFLSDEQAKPLIDYTWEHPMWVREVYITKRYETPFGDLIVTMKVDALEGIFVRDTKTKYSTVDMIEYIDSFQWKVYLDALGLNYFFYDVFEVKGLGDHFNVPNARIIPLEPMMLTRYPGMEDDIQSTINEFMDYIHFKGFEEYITIKPGSAVDHEHKIYNTQPLTDESPMPWGNKHKGLPMIQVPASYLLWMFEKDMGGELIRQYTINNFDRLKAENNVK